MATKSVETPSVALKRPAPPTASAAAETPSVEIATADVVAGLHVGGRRARCDVHTHSVDSLRADVANTSKSRQPGDLLIVESWFSRGVIAFPTTGFGEPKRRGGL